MDKLWLALTAVFEFLKIIFSKQQKIEEKKDEKKDDLKEKMHIALLSGDNTAIALCLNEYRQLRAQAKYASN